MKNASICVLAFLILPTAVSLGATASYSIANLGSLGGPSMGMAINDHGQVVGDALLADGTERPFLWQQNTGMIDLGNLPGDGGGIALGINNAGVVVGNSMPAPVINADAHAFSWNPDVGMTDLGKSTSLSSVVRSINDNGQIVGTAGGYAFDSNVFGFIYSLATGITPVTVPSMTITDVGALNNAGQMVVGGPNTQGAMFYSPGSAPILMRNDDYVAGAGMAMNDSGTVVGFAGKTDGDSPHAYSWSLSTGFIDLTPGIGASGMAFGINNADQIVGEVSLTRGGPQFGFIYENGVTSDLLSLVDASGAGWSAVYPTAINNNGQITGTGTFNGEQRAFLLMPVAAQSSTPVPEPTTACTLLLASAIALTRRSDKRNAATV